MARTKKRTPRNSSKGQRNYKRGNNRSDIKDKDSIEDPKKSSNDPAWYAANPVILRDAASYPFSYNTGATEVHNLGVWQNANFDKLPIEQIPGIMSLHVYPTVGTAINATDPINVAAQSVYSFVRHANSGHSNYDAPDLMLYIMAMANMYSYLVFCERAYGYALTYDQRNRYIPNDLLRTNNIDAGDLVANLANFRFWINTLISKMVSFAVPATMSVFSRMSFIYSDYYVEGTSIKEQLYQYVPEGFYKFSIDGDSLGQLEWKPFDYTTLMTTQDLIDFGNELFDAIWSQEDFGIMSGDILKAYGNNIIKLASLDEYYNIAPKFDPMVLTQMKNASIVRVTPGRISQSATYGTIVQTLIPNGYSTADTYYGTTGTIPSGQITPLNNAMVAALKDYDILTVDTDDPTPDVVIEATRLKVAYDDYKAWYKAGTELITRVVLTVNPGSDIETPPFVVTFSNVSTDDTAWVPLMNLLCASRNFHYMPRIWIFCVDGVDIKIDIRDVFDIDNFTLLTYEDIRKLHEAATVNMFAVPSIGKVE